MNLDHLINNKNEALYNQIAAYLSVQLQRNEDWRADAWTSRIENEVAFIKYCDEEVDCPQAAFTRELLCLELQLKGFKRIYTGISLKNAHQKRLLPLIKKLDFELLNHKIAEAFLRLGFDKEEFYGYKYEQSVNYFLDFLKDENHSLLSLCTLYLSCIQPFNNWSLTERADIETYFYHYNHGIYQKHFKKINTIINEWKTSENYDATPFIIAFCKNVGLVETWLSYEKKAVDINHQTFPNSGFFIQNEFTLEDFQKEYDII